MRRLMTICWAVGLTGCGHLPEFDPRAVVDMAEANSRYYQAAALQHQRDMLNATRPQPVQPVQIQNQAAGVAFLKSSYRSGQNKICVYDRLGSQYVVTVASFELCPLTQ